MAEFTGEDRLERIERLLEFRKKRSSRLNWITYNPLAEYGFDIEDAEEDLAWMVWEIKRLRRENSEFREFIDEIRSQMEQELGSCPPRPWN